MHRVQFRPSRRRDGQKATDFWNFARSLSVNKILSNSTGILDPEAPAELRQGTFSRLSEEQSAGLLTVLTLRWSDLDAVMKATKTFDID